MSSSHASRNGRVIPSLKKGASLVAPAESRFTRGTGRAAAVSVSHQVSCAEPRAVYAQRRAAVLGRPWRPHQRARLNSNRVFAAFAGADAYRFVDRADEDFAIADTVGLRALQNSV